MVITQFHSLIFLCCYCFNISFNIVLIFKFGIVFLVIMQFIVEMHCKIAAAVHHRHKCCRLAGIEVLIDVLGHRAAISSTSRCVTITEFKIFLNKIIYVQVIYKCYQLIDLPKNLKAFNVNISVNSLINGVFLIEDFFVTCLILFYYSLCIKLLSILGQFNCSPWHKNNIFAVCFKFLQCDFHSSHFT